MFGFRSTESKIRWSDLWKSVDQAERICKLKFNKANSKSSSKKGSAENTEKVQNKASENTTASAEFNRSIDKPDFSVFSAEPCLVLKNLKIILELCKLVLIFKKVNLRHPPDIFC